MVCVRQAGYDYTDEQFEAVFLRIYGIFGSSAPYEVYADAKPFLRWVREQGIVVGILSNASFRYRDDILPQLGLKQVRFLDPHSGTFRLLGANECGQAQPDFTDKLELVAFCSGRRVGFRRLFWH